MKKNAGILAIGIFMFLGVIVGVIALSSNLAVFINIPSGLFVILAGCGLGLASYKDGGFLKYMEACKKHFLSAGVLGAVTGTVIVLEHISRPSELGAGMAVAILSVFYGVVLYCVADVFASRVSDKG